MGEVVPIPIISLTGARGETLLKVSKRFGIAKFLKFGGHFVLLLYLFHLANKCLM